MLFIFLGLVAAYVGYKVAVNNPTFCKMLITWTLDRYEINIVIDDRSDQDEKYVVYKSNADIVVLDSSWWVDMYDNPSLAMGDGYMDGKYTTKDLRKTLHLLLEKTNVRNKGMVTSSVLRYILNIFRNLQSIARSKTVAEEHYNISPMLYRTMLDPWMQYSCGWWGKGVNSLEEAQEYKLRLICEKLDLRPGMKVLDVGCGWGGLMSYMKKHYNVEVVGLTISEEQVQLGREMFANISECFVLEDYRTWCPKHVGEFDRVVSVGMFEHVGYSNYTTYFQHISSVLKENGLFVLHTIGSTIPSPYPNSWIDKHIFRNGMLPSMSVMATALESSFIIEDVSNTPAYYSQTLDAWYSRVLPHLNNSPLTERFKRMWNFYLISCSVGFNVGALCLYQLVLTKNGYRDLNGNRASVVRRT